MEKVLNQAEQLAEAILESDEYIAMRLAERAALKDEAATNLITAYSEQRKEVENLLASSDMDHSALAEAGAKLEEAQKAMDENDLIKSMREANDVFNTMMQQVNKLIRFVVTGESDEEEGCSCDSCGGSCGDGCGEGCHCN
ncbi:MAG: YlbF family regulator [Eubacteriales bacterium]|nr:YlbF family regulator [Eubacteriales bacterium]